MQIIFLKQAFRKPILKLETWCVKQYKRLTDRMKEYHSPSHVYESCYGFKIKNLQRKKVAQKQT